MATSGGHPRAQRTRIGALAFLLVAAAFLGVPGHSRGAAALATQASVNVAVVPGFKAPIYPGYSGVGAFPAGNSRLSAFHFTELSGGKLTASNLSAYDTMILYGLRWNTLSANQQSAINTFAVTHKVMIWDSDGTGAQDYGTFVQPFTTLASNASGKPSGAVVTFPKFAAGVVDFLASDSPSSPYYLEPSQLVSNASMINDMNAMKTGTKNWAPGLVAQNKNIPNGAWPLAWSYGSIGNHTGMTIYSGMDADAIDNSQLNPNDEITELALELKAPFRTTPDSSCAPNCAGPPQPISGGGGGGGGGGVHADCSFAKRVTTHWVHGRVPVLLKTSTASGITGQVLSASGKMLASGTEAQGLIHFRVKTRPLPTNHASQLKAVVLVNGQSACSKSFKLKVDNTPPKLLYLHVSSGHVAFRVSEKSQMRIAGGGPRYRHWVTVARRRLIYVSLPGVRHAQLILRDRAGNTIKRNLR